MGKTRKVYLKIEYQVINLKRKIELEKPILAITVITILGNYQQWILKWVVKFCWKIGYYNVSKQKHSLILVMKKHQEKKNSKSKGTTQRLWPVL